MNQAVDKKLRPTVHNGFATSFADPNDVAAFRKCKAEGKSDNECFKLGDNAIGCWGDDTSEGSGASCAVPPDDMIKQFGSIAAAKHKQVAVTVKEKTATVTLKDRMPWKKNIKNKAVIDLNPDSCAALGLKPPVRVKANWIWA